MIEQKKFDGARTDMSGTHPPVHFHCRECGSTRMVETMKDVTVESECSIGDHGIEYGKQTNTDGEVVNYQCSNGHIVKGADGEPITTEDELIQHCEGNDV